MKEFIHALSATVVEPHLLAEHEIVVLASFMPNLKYTNIGPVQGLSLILVNKPCGGWIVLQTALLTRD